MLKNKYLKAIIAMLLVLYVPRMQIILPQYLLTIFNNIIFKIVFIWIALLYFEYDVDTALLIATIFVISVDVFRRYFYNEPFADDDDMNPPYDKEKCLLIYNKFNEGNFCYNKLSKNCETLSGYEKTTCQKKAVDFYNLKMNMQKIVDNNCDQHIDYATQVPTSFVCE